MNHTLNRRKAEGHPRAIPNRECFRVNLRDRLACALCGRVPHARDRYHRGFEYHHVAPVRHGGAGEAENLILLCRACHRAADAGALAIPPERLAVPEADACHACGAPFDPRTVEMNCGWYACATCGQRVSLFDHFDYAE